MDNSQSPAAVFLRTIFEPGDTVCIAAKKTDARGFHTEFGPRDEICAEEYLNKLAGMNDDGMNIYVCMNPILAGHTRRRKQDIGEIRNVYLDLDADGKTKFDAILASTEVPPPTVVLESSPGKFQIIWSIRGIAKEQQESLLDSLIAKFGGDPAASDCSRVLRLPGFANTKYESSPIVSIVHENGVHGPYSLEDFKIGAKAEVKKTPVEIYGFDVDGPQVPHGEHDVTLHSIAGKLRSMGWEEPAIYDRLFAICEKRIPTRGADWIDMIKKHAVRICDKPAGIENTVLIGGKPAGSSSQGAADSQDSSSRNAKSYEFMGFEHTLSPEEFEEELGKDYPIIPLVKQVGPEWSDDILYGLTGEIIKKASTYNEAHPAGMLLDLLVSLGNMFGRNPYFTINKTKHYANEFMVRVGDSAYSRKGGGRDEIDALLKLVDADWFKNRTQSGFGSAEAIISKIKDSTEQQRFVPAKNTHITVRVPGVDDKRLCIREGELASIFVLAGKQESRADIVLRDGWDGKPLKNVVKGTTKDGLTNSLICEEPHISISGDTTRSELVRKMPDGSDENGFGNRFIYCSVYRVKLCPHGGPEIDWTEAEPGKESYLSRLYSAKEFAKKQGYVPLAPAAKNTWTRMYLQIENSHLPGLAGKMTSRAAPHIRRLAMIYAMIDMESAVDTKHLRAAERFWNYCEDSAQFSFNSMTKNQLRLVQWMAKKQQPVTLSNIRDEFYQRHEKAEHIKAIMTDLVRLGHVTQTGETYKIK
jgi:hypothetical protein